MAAPLIILTGPPGAGKTTVAAYVAAAFDLAVHLHGDDFWAVIKQGGVAPYEPESQRQNEVVVSAIAAAAAVYAAGGYTVVVDGIIGPWFLERFRTGVPRNVQLHYIVLRPTIDVARSRAIGRTEGLVDETPIRHMYEEFASRLGSLESHVIDSSTLTPEETADIVVSAVSRQSHVLGAGPTGGSPPLRAAPG